MTTQEPQQDNADVISHPKSSRILRLNEVKRRTGLSRSSIYAFMKAGTFPQHISLGARSVGWYEHEVDAWVVSRKRVQETQS